MSNFQSRRAFGARSTATAVTNVPDVCPACRSAAIATTSKNPGSDSYWRCARCGEIWNQSRYRAPRVR